MTSVFGMMGYMKNELLLRVPFSKLASNEMFMSKTKAVAEMYSNGEHHWLLIFLDDMLSFYGAERMLSLQGALSIFEDAIKRKELWWLRGTTNNYLSPQKSTYMCAVALLESVNYWCSYYSYASIRFDEEGLRETLSYPLSINVGFYLEK